MRERAGAARLVRADAQRRGGGGGARCSSSPGVPDAEPRGGWRSVARAHRVLVNVEDVPPLCDAYALAMVRRGNLVIGVSTEGRSPARGPRAAAVAGGALRPGMGGAAGAGRRACAPALRAEGAAPPDITAATAQMLEAWLGEPSPGAAGGAPGG